LADLTTTAVTLGEFDTPRDDTAAIIHGIPFYAGAQTILQQELLTAESAVGLIAFQTASNQS